MSRHKFANIFMYPGLCERVKTVKL